MALVDLTQESVRRALPPIPRNGPRRVLGALWLRQGLETILFLIGACPAFSAAAKRLKDLGFNVTDRPEPEFAINFEPGKLYNKAS
jgi:hypothetical protein